MSKSTLKKSAIYLGWQGNPFSEIVLDIISQSFDVVYHQHMHWEEQLDQAVLASMEADFLFSFGPLIVKKELLDSVKTAAINFHSGPPKWPGRHGCCYAIVDGDSDFGVTAHIMVEEVDQGPILKVRRFPIDADDTGESVHQKALKEIPRLVQDTIRALADNAWEPCASGEQWERQAVKHAELEKRKVISALDSAETKERKRRAFTC